VSDHPIAAADKLVLTGERHRYRLDVQYDGTDFSGMQWQPDRRTVQQSLEEALEPLFEKRVRIIPSSRTDAGVHAARQVAHVDAPVQRPLASIVRAGNSYLPPDVRILSAELVNQDFHARFSARWRGYKYRISRVPLAIGRQYVWEFPQPMEIERLNPLAKSIEGMHSFAAFAHENPVERHDYECTIFRSEWVFEGNKLTYCIEASRFVHGMVRMLVGSMIDYACDRRNGKTLLEILESGDNRNSGTKAPASGLTLETVGYGTWPNV
jgi:tRNA pseudouridine38-40 synthase